MRSAAIILISVFLYYLLIGKYTLSSWGQWILYAIIASIITVIITGIGYYLTEKTIYGLRRYGTQS